MVADMELFMLDMLRCVGILIFLYAITKGKFFAAKEDIGKEEEDEFHIKRGVKNELDK